jgi:ubiquinone/menaquinone biosynthesis C-methylase UbiE
MNLAEFEHVVRRTLIEGNYADWASTYDTTMKNYDAHIVLAEAIKKHRPNLSNPAVVDACIGTGLLSEAIKRNFTNASILGLDLSEDMLNEAAEKCVADKLKRCDLQTVEWPTQSQSSDIIACSGSLELFSDTTHFLAESFRTIKLGGILAATHMTTPTNTTTLHHRTRPDFRRAVEQAGFRILDHFEQNVTITMQDRTLSYDYGYMIAEKPDPNALS